MRPAALQVLAALPVFLLGAAVVLITYQARLSWQPAPQPTDDWDGLQLLEHQGGDLLDAADDPGDLQQQQQPVDEAPPFDTLVIYIYNEDDPVYYENFRHFVLTAVQQPQPQPQQPQRQGRCCRFVVLVQERSLRSAAVLPEVPGLQYVYYAGPCYEWGMVGWLLSEPICQQHDLQWQQYSYFVLMSSAVRGPFLPAYLQQQVHWTQPLISRLTGRVKLVGPTVVCGEAPSCEEPDQPLQPGSPKPDWRRNPHLPFSALATDRAGLDVLRSEQQVMACHTSAWAAKYHSELGAAAALFKAGYSIDSLLIRYQGVDWRDNSSWGCNRHWDPADVGDFSYDGLSLDPLEATFVRVNSRLLAQRVPMAVKAAKYSEWMADVAAGVAGLPHNLTARVSANHYQQDKGRYKLPRILTALVRGVACFDIPFFKSHNKDILKKATDALTWKFFVYLGQFEDRPFRFTCGINYTSIAVPPGMRQK